MTAAVVTFLSVRAQTQLDSFIDSNIEALATPEVSVGQMCAYDIVMCCIYFNPFEIYEGLYI